MHLGTKLSWEWLAIQYEIKYETARVVASSTQDGVEDDLLANGAATRWHVVCVYSFVWLHAP